MDLSAYVKFLTIALDFFSWFMLSASCLFGAQTSLFFVVPRQTSRSFDGCSLERKKTSQRYVLDLDRGDSASLIVCIFCAGGQRVA